MKTKTTTNKTAKQKQRKLQQKHKQNYKKKIPKTKPKLPQKKHSKTYWKHLIIQRKILYWRHTRTYKNKSNKNISEICENVFFKQLWNKLYTYIYRHNI